MCKNKLKIDNEEESRINQFYQKILTLDAIKVKQTNLKINYAGHIGDNMF